MKAALVPLIALLAASCTSQGPQSQLGTQQKAREQQQYKLVRTNDCVFQSTVNDFHALDDRHVVLYGMGRSKAYLAELQGGCFDLRGQSTLASVDGDRNGQICGFGRDAMAYRHVGRVEQCRILGLEALSDERLVALGLAEPQSAQRKDGKPKDESSPASPP
jgi:hypothetical protein